jgi:hypothetical protein
MKVSIKTNWPVKKKWSKLVAPAETFKTPWDIIQKIFNVHPDKNTGGFPCTYAKLLV